MTVFRKLSELSYLTSCSQRGKCYTLCALCRFDADGLWSDGRPLISRFGTLQNTCRHFVERSEVRFTVTELDVALHVDTRQALPRLHRRGLLEREKFEGLKADVHHDCEADDLGRGFEISEGIAHF